MKIITQDGIAKYCFEDGDEVDVQSDRIIAPDLMIGDLNNTNSVLHINVADVPEDYEGLKYLYNGTWISNPDYIEED